VEQRQWRLLRTFNQANGRIPTGSAEVEWTSEETPQDQQKGGRQHSAPEISEVVARPKLMREIAKNECTEGIAEAQAVMEARILDGRRNVQVKKDIRAFRVRLGLAGMRVFEEQR